MNRWAIIDDEGTIEEGDEVDVKMAFEHYRSEGFGDVRGPFGDVKLVEIHGVIR